MAHTPHSSTPRELQRRVEAERLGIPLLCYRDAKGEQVIRLLQPPDAPLTIGRGAECDVALHWDPEVSRVHAQLERVAGEWALVDDGLSRNGSWINGERVLGRRRLRDGDRICVGEVTIDFRAPEQAGLESTASVRTGPGDVPLTPAQRKVLVALCRPVKESAYAPPATNREIATEVFLSVDAVKAHLRVLFERFGLDHLPQNQKRARLAAIALVNGLVGARDF
jgi:pSer/pThr/pTyr-binding forkhead associated (FHA) protein